MRLNSDVVSISGATAAFADKNAGPAKAVNVSAVLLAGPDAGNYTATPPVGVTANITPASLTVSGLTANNKTYDATTAATLSGTPTLGGILLSDVVTASGGTGTFANKNVGAAKPVTVSGITLGGADAGNYTVTPPVGLTANITPASLTVSGLTANSKTYDATTGATLTGTPTLGGILLSDVVTASGGTGTFADKNVGVAKPVTVSGVTLAGADAGNYTLTPPVGLTATITPASHASRRFPASMRRSR